MSAIAIDSKGELLDEVAPDLGAEYGSTQCRRKIRSTNPVVQRAIDGVNNNDLSVDESRKSIQEIKEEIVSLKNELGGLIVSVDKTVKDAQSVVSQNISEVRDSANDRIRDFIKSHAAKCEDLEGKLKDCLSRATIGRLSNQFEQKREELSKAYKRSQDCFYGSLIMFVVLGVVAILLASSLATPEQDKNHGLLSFVMQMPRAILQFVPFYLPLLWYTCHANKLMSQNRRLMEEYAHKVVVAHTYNGLAEQVDELEKKGVSQTKTLSQDLLDSTIRVLCANPNESLDKVKVQTPVSEIVENVVKLVRATTDMKGGR